MNLQPNPRTAKEMRDIRESILIVTDREVKYRPGAEELPIPAGDAPVVVVVGGGMMQWESFVQARLMGFRVVMTDRNPACFMAAHADIFRPIDVFDHEGHRMLVQNLRDSGYEVAGIFVAGIDAEYTAALVAQTCGLPGISTGAAERCKDKAEMRRAFDRVMPDAPNRLPWCTASDVSEVSPEVWVAMGRHGALVVKPLRQSASRGVTIARSVSEVEHGIRAALAANGEGGGPALLEAYISGGRQYSVEIARIDGKWLGLNVVDRFFDDINPALELGHVNPSRESPHEVQKFYDLAEQAATAVGVDHGVFKCDIITDDYAVPYVLECTARLSGGFDSQITTPLTGRNFVALGLALATGRAIDPDWLRRQSWWSVACVAAFPPAGKVLFSVVAVGSPSIRFVHKSRLSENIGADVIRVGVGDTIPPYLDCGARQAFVIRVGQAYSRHDPHKDDGKNSRSAWNIARRDALDLARNEIRVENPDHTTVPNIPLEAYL